MTADTDPQSSRDSHAAPRSSTTFPSYLVTPEQLNCALQSETQSRGSNGPRIKPLCATWSRPSDNCSGLDEFRVGHIHGSQFFDLDTIRDINSPFPHMLPSPELFAAAMSSLGIRRNDTVVVYDSAEVGIYSAPRVGWMLRVFGHPRVHVLNNYKLWVDAGFPVESSAPEDPEPSQYPVPDVDRSKLVQFEEMQKLCPAETSCQPRNVYILDARSFGRWSGQEEEPIPGILSGSIPGSMSFPASELLDPATKAFRSPRELRAIFESRGIDPSRPIISTCGTGITAATIDTALIEAGYGEGERRLYDGSWTEWTQRIRDSYVNESQTT